MDEFVKNLSSPSWWLGVFVVGLIVEMLGGSLRDWLGKLLAKISEYWALKRRIRSKKQQQLLRDLKSDDTLLCLYAMRESRYRTRALFALVLGIVFMGVALQLVDTNKWLSIFMLTLSFLNLTGALSDHASAMYVKHIVESVKQILKT